MTLDLSASRTYPATLEDAFPVTLSTPLAEFLSRRYLALSPVRETRDQVGDWTAAGDARTIVLTDGSTMRETLLTVAAPSEFTYRLSALKGPLAPLATSVLGRFAFEPAGTGVRITWSWSLEPRSPLGPLLLPAFGRMWRGYARQALDALEQRLVS